MAAPPLPAPHALAGGRYVLGEELGRGGMARVFVGMNTVTGRRYAIKLLNPKAAPTSALRSRASSGYLPR